MKKEEELKMMLAKLSRFFDKQEYENALLELDKTGKFIIKELNFYNNKH